MPTFSILTPVYDPPLHVFADTAASVLAQTHDDWEWILIDDRSPEDGIRDYMHALAARDPRVHVLERERNGGIVAASNDGISDATGEFIVLLDHDDQLLPHSLARVAAAIADDDRVDYLYSDESIIQDGVVVGTFTKPDWSPERLRHQMYTSHLSVLRTELVRAVGGFHDGFDGSQDHDLVLRVTERARSVVHIPEVLYWWRVIEGSTADSSDMEAKPYAWHAGQRAVQAHLDRMGIRAVAQLGPSRGYFTLDRELDTHAAISVIIPTIGTRGRVRGVERCFVVECVRSLLEKTVTERIEIVVVYDTPTPPEVLDELREVAGNSLVLIEYAEKFNFSRKCNVGFLHATGDYVVFLNDDMEAHSDRPLETLVAPLRDPSVGVTGARLLFENTTHQHAGLVYGNGTVHPAHYRAPWEHPGHFGSLWVTRETSALTGACLAMTRQTFVDAGGFNETLALNYNDVDLCMKVRHLDRSLLWMHDVILFHFESVSRETRVEPWESALLTSRWGKTSQRERYGLVV